MATSLPVLRGAPGETTQQVADRLTRQSDLFANGVNAEASKTDKRLITLEKSSGGGWQEARVAADEARITSLEGQLPVDLSNYVAKTGDQTMQGPLHVQGQIETTANGVKFPDGSVQITAAGANAWITALDLDFTSESSQTLTSNGNYTIGGLTWTKENSTNDNVAMAVTNGSGLVIQPKNTSDYNGTTRTLPLIHTSLAGILPNIQPTTPVRIWLYVSAENISANYDGVKYGIETVNPNPKSNSTLSGFHYSASSPYKGQLYGGAYNNGTSMSWGVAPTSDNCQCLELIRGIAGMQFLFMSGVWSSGWPSVTALHMQAESVLTSGFQGIEYLGSCNDWRLFIGGQRAGSGTALSLTIARLRVQYL